VVVFIFTSVLDLGNEEDSWGPGSEKVKSGWKKCLMRSLEKFIPHWIL
jgi:hypothetical protein